MTKPNSAPQAGGDETPVALTDEQAHAIHSHPLVRDCLLAYVDRPCDREATAVVRTIYNAANGLILGATRPTPAAAAGVPSERFIMDHGMWHDILTGQHLYTEDQHSAALKDLADEAWSALEAAGIPRDGVRSLGESISKLAASPVAPAGVPSYDECKTGNVLLDLLMRDRFATTQWPENWMAVRGLLIEAQRLVSAGAPAVPLKDEHSSSVHLAADGSSRALRAASQETPRAWQPIETAPKDGSEILAWRWDCGVFMAKYTCADSLSSMTDKERDELDEASLFGEDWFGGDSDSNWRLEGSEVPTHWMPLPPEPVQCDGCDGVTGSGASSEAREATSSSSGSDGHGKDCA